MPLPPFAPDGFLPDGIWTASGKEFVSRFCSGEYRQSLTKAVTDIFDFALERGATRVLVGGSFVAQRDKPRDIDCAIIFEDENQIPSRVERLELETTSLDVFFCSQDQPKLLASMVALFRSNRSGRAVGVVDVLLRSEGGGRLWDTLQYPDDETLQIVQRAYFNRHLVERKTENRALITVHGIRSHGEWSAEVCHIASSNGWIVAPFSYGYTDASVFLRPSKRREIVDRFRDHIHEIVTLYDTEVSVIAHSFGTYVVAKYLLGFDVPPIGVDTLILTGAVLNENLDLSDFYGRAGHILNEVAPNDSWVRFPPLARFQDKLFGRAGRVGFKETPSRLEQRSSDVFDHNNVIKRDVVVQRWMPRLEVNVGSWRRDAYAKMRGETPT